MHRSVGVGNHIAVRENHTLGLPGSARCIDDLSAVISIRVDGLEKHRMDLRDSPYFQDPVEGDGELCAVAHEEAHAITFHHTQLRESVGEAISVATKLRVCPAAISVDQRLVVREKDGIPVQRLRYIHQLLLLPSSVCLSQSIFCSRA